MCPSGTTAAGATNGSAFRSAFDVLDADRDGKISREDLRAFCYSAPAIREEDIGSMIAAADLDRDGYVEFEEFERILGGRRGAGEEVENGTDGLMEEVFRALDRDGDGRVGFEDLKEYFVAAGMPAADEDVRAMIRVGGGGEGGGICLQGLKRILAV